MIDLTKAAVVVSANASRLEAKAATVLVEEVEKRAAVHWSVAERPPENVPTVRLITRSPQSERRGPDTETRRSQRSSAADGYTIQTADSGLEVSVSGNDPRGLLFGVGRLLRELRMSRGSIQLPARFRVTSAPRYPLRGHQLGYRPKTNSYDGWDLPQWEQYIRDLAVFGTNAVELIPPRSDDDEDSPHFPRPPIEMLVGMSRLLDEYGMDVWLWYPAMDEDYSKPGTVESALKEWGAVFERLPRVDHVFVPGGDPGHTRPDVLMPLLEKATEVLHRYHPRAKLWVSPQGFKQEWLDEFYRILKTEPKWLAGVVHGPQVRVSLAELQAAVPSRYPIRSYPDITHSLQCQYPVPDWDLAFALTEAREVINPRPVGQAAIFRTLPSQSIGFLTYSEGCNDDVNKFVWSGLGWDPETNVVDLLRQYSRYFVGDRFTEGFAQGLLALERNWQGPLLTNHSVETTLNQFQEMERSARPRDLLNWRFQQAIYRAYYDAYVRDRLLYETDLESQAIRVLRRAPEIGSLAAMEQAQEILNRTLTHPIATDRKARVEALAEALFQSVRMQLSVKRYQAISVDRGATLDTIDVPLNNRAWLEWRFAAIRRSEREEERLEQIDAIVNRTNPGPGGFYDDLGNLSQQPHLVRGAGFESDPAFLRSALVGFGEPPSEPWPIAWYTNAQSLVDAPLTMRYEQLDRNAGYTVRVVYSGDSFKTRIRLEAEGREIHPLMKKPLPVRVLEFDVPPEATSDGALTLSWTRDPGLGGNGRGCEVGEVWLIRKTDRSAGDR